MLTSISLIFTQGQCNPSLSEAFKKTNLSINASSCEFLEFMLSHVDNPDIIMFDDSEKTFTDEENIVFETSLHLINVF